LKPEVEVKELPRATIDERLATLKYQQTEGTATEVVEQLTDCRSLALRQQQRGGGLLHAQAELMERRFVERPTG
jgi:hypothetical protein